MKLKSALQEHPNLDLSGFPLFAQINRRATKLFTLFLPIFSFFFTIATLDAGGETTFEHQLIFASIVAGVFCCYGFLYACSEGYTVEVTLSDGKVSLVNRHKSSSS